VTLLGTKICRAFTSAPPVWRLEFGRYQTRAFGGHEPGGSIMRTLFHSFIDDQSGVTAIEYCLIVALIAVAIIVAVTTDQSPPREARNNSVRSAAPRTRPAARSTRRSHAVAANH
jgi:hypothetical protein